jgi:hypothetical protein
MKHVCLIHGLLSCIATVALAAWPSSSASAAQLHELPSILVIAKSSNRNQVRYAALVDETCAPAGQSPVRPYWLMLERGPDATEPLQPREERILGVAHQQVSGDTVQFELRGMTARAFTVHTARTSDGQCASWVGTTIAGVPAHVTGVFAKQSLFGVDYVLLTGRSDDGKVVSERVSP